MRSPRTSIHRRTALKALGLFGAAYFLPSLRGLPLGRADPPSIPRRIVFFYENQGLFHDQWTPVGVGGAPPTQTQWTLGPMMSPLLPFQPKLVFLDAVDMLSNDVDPTGAANAHIAGETHALTATSRATANLAGGISIDQYIASSLNSPNPITALPSLELAIGLGAVSQEGQPCYSGPSQPLPMEPDPNNVFARLFPQGGAMADNPAARHSVLDFAQGEFAAVRPRLSSADRTKLDAHASAVRDLEARLDILAAQKCVAPAEVLDGLNAPMGSGERYDAYAEAMMRLMTVALTCDLTRVITVNVDFPPWELFGYDPGMFGSTDEHDLVHKTNGSDPTVASNPDAVAVIARAYESNVNYLARFLAMLDGVPEGDGQTLLDHTAVVLCGQIAKGNHDLHQCPWIIAGSCGGAFKTGRYLQFPRDGQNHGPPHNDLFVSLANAMGVPTTTFGNPAVCTGPLALLT